LNNLLREGPLTENLVRYLVNTLMKNEK
jgi:hypothetical protein